MPEPWVPCPRATCVRAGARGMWNRLGELHCIQVWVESGQSAWAVSLKGESHICEGGPHRLTRWLKEVHRSHTQANWRTLIVDNVDHVVLDPREKCQLCISRNLALIMHTTSTKFPPMASTTMSPEWGKFEQEAHCICYGHWTTTVGIGTTCNEWLSCAWGTYRKNGHMIFVALMKVLNVWGFILSWS